MLTLPCVVEKEAVPYLAIEASVLMDQLGKVGPGLHSELFDWCQANGVTPAGGPFFRYKVIDMAGLLRMEFGTAITQPVPGSDRIISGLLPAGRYAQISYTGPYDNLYDVNAVLIGWAKERGISWDAAETPEGEAFACRLETYETDELAEPDPSKWVTTLSIKTAG